MTVSRVGIFWRIGATGAAPELLVDCVPVAHAESYGDFLTHGGHYEFWCALSRLSASELRQRNVPDVVLWSEYEEWPRGRVVFHVPSDRFIIYADRKLQGSATIDRIVQRFRLTRDRVDILGDPHYISLR
ncbi:hypothetical protein [Limobrevibacterium gyesilva]|uniref:Uncharacterized protein n=1 Tax=Limobrevibacterium gyesilva TaxID=2991712 RepID=A0AA41YNS9_9PROT|nr:hypothetical protein [Limobrevibacterium gyesilva]MCW3475931.1 hypothetical protein [Limobrevibacterium gyesilva]